MFGGVTKYSNEGSTKREATAAKKIMIAVKIPYAANIGIGANAMTTNPMMLVADEAINAAPVPVTVRRMARSRSPVMLSSCLNRSVKCTE